MSNRVVQKKSGLFPVLSVVALCVFLGCIWLGYGNPKPSRAVLAQNLAQCEIFTKPKQWVVCKTDDQHTIVWDDHSNTQLVIRNGSIPNLEHLSVGNTVRFTVRIKPPGTERLSPSQAFEYLTYTFTDGTKILVIDPPERL